LKEEERGSCSVSSEKEKEVARHRLSAQGGEKELVHYEENPRQDNG